MILIRLYKVKENSPRPWTNLHFENIVLDIFKLTSKKKTKKAAGRIKVSDLKVQSTVGTGRTGHVSGLHLSNLESYSET